MHLELGAQHILRFAHDQLLTLLVRMQGKWSWNGSLADDKESYDVSGKD